MRLIFVPAWRSAWPAAWRPGSAWRKAPVPVCEAARDTRTRDTGAGDTARDVDVDVLNTKEKIELVDISCQHFSIKISIQLLILSSYQINSA